jgi:hypothetical protein
MLLFPVSYDSRRRSTVSVTRRQISHTAYPRLQERSANAYMTK